MSWQDNLEGDSGCEGCNVLMEALREAERQCRELEDAGASRGLSFMKDGSDAAYVEEQDYLLKLQVLERRRNCALEVLLKHQKFEHSA
jgi:hypothetical protein